jgi:hypothetical protein
MFLKRPSCWWLLDSSIELKQNKCICLLGASEIRVINRKEWDIVLTLICV